MNMDELRSELNMRNIGKNVLSCSIQRCETIGWCGLLLTVGSMLNYAVAVHVKSTVTDMSFGLHISAYHLLLIVFGTLKENVQADKGTLIKWYNPIPYYYIYNVYVGLVNY